MLSLPLILSRTLQLTLFQNAQVAGRVLLGPLFETCLTLAHYIHTIEYHLRWNHSSLELICSRCPLPHIANNQHNTVKTKIRDLDIEICIF